MKSFSQLKSEINESVNRTHVISKFEIIKERLQGLRQDCGSFEAESRAISILQEMKETLSPTDSLIKEIDSLIRNEDIDDINLIKSPFSRLKINEVFRHGGDWFKKTTKEAFVNVWTGKRHFQSSDMPEFYVYQDSHDLLGENRFKWVNEDIANSVGDAPGSIAGVSDNDPPVYGTGKFGKDCVFDVDSDAFSKCRQGKRKFARWSKYIDKESDHGKKVYEYAKRFPKKPIVIRQQNTGIMLYARR